MSDKNIQIGLLVMLGISAFYIGSLQQRVRNLQEKLPASGSNVVNNVANPQNNNVPSESAVDRMNRFLGGLNIDVNQFAECVVSEEAVNFVKAQEQTGIRAGVNGTPGNFLIDTQTKQVVSVPGAVPQDMVVTAYNDLLAGNGDTSIDLEGLQDSDFVRGDRNARVLLIEYSDYDCSFCSRFHPTAQQMIEEYAGQIAWVYRQFPLDQIHPDARIKSQGAYCAGKLAGNDAFWSFTDSMLLN